MFPNEQNKLKKKLPQTMWKVERANKTSTIWKQNYKNIMCMLDVD